MNTFYTFVHKKYILTVIERAAYNKSNKLKLANFDIEELPPEIAECQELRRLCLQHNKLTHLPIGIAQLVNLKLLAIDFNNLSCMPTSLWNLHNLTEINISHNPIKILPPEIKHLVNLELLWINCCEISKLPDEICDLKSLDTLGARNNFLIDLPLKFYKLNIRWLTLESNQLSYLPANFKLKNLTHLNLSNNNFTSIPPQISKLTKLKYCLLQRNKISHFKKTQMVRLKHIFKINLQENPIESYDELKKYQNLALSNIEFHNTVESDSDSSEVWEESLNSSEIDISSSDSEAGDNEVIQFVPSTSKYFLS